jgi:hypothetical protein
MTPTGQEAILAESGSALSGPHRRHFREKLRRTTYLNLDDSNGGVIRDLSEAGLALQAVVALQPNQRLQLRFELPAPRLRVTVSGRVAWSDSKGRGGVEFVDMPERPRRLLQQWLLTQLLVRACEAFRRDSIFDHWKEEASAGRELSFSARARPAIHISQGRASGLGATARMCGFTISRKYLVRLADCTVLLLGALLFLAVAFAATGVVLPWPRLLTSGLVFTIVCGALYWVVCAAVIGATPGAGIVRVLCRDSRDEQCEEGERFR